jgi:site-specific DNA recombinase
VKKKSGNDVPATSNDTIGAVVYCRVSTKEQTQNLSLPTQERSCRAYCEREGFTVARVFVEEGESAKTAERTKLLELLDYCRDKKGTIKHVVVYRIDRFSRQQYDYIVLAAQLKKYGVTLKSATEPISDDSTGKLMEHILSAFAQFDNDVRSERTIAGMRAALESGQWTFSAPIGYRRKAKPTAKDSIEPDPTSGPLVKKAFELYAAGLQTKSQVLRKITAMGLRTRNGKKLTAQTFQELLRKPIYVGLISVPTWGIERVKGDFQPLITEDLFDRVQDVLDGRALSVTPHQQNHPDFPLRRFARCGNCGLPITGSWSKGRARRYAYYRCRSARCLSVKVSKNQFEREFAEFLNALRPRAEYVRLFREIVLDVWRCKQGDANAVSNAIERRIKEIEGKRQSLLEAHVYHKSLDAELYRREDDRLSQEIALARMELHDKQIEEIDIEGVLGFAENIILDARRLWTEGTLDQRQRLQKVLFPSGVTYSNQAGFGTKETSLFFRWLALVQEKKDNLASPTGFEPVIQPSNNLHQLLSIRDYYKVRRRKVG